MEFHKVCAKSQIYICMIRYEFLVGGRGGNGRGDNRKPFYESNQIASNIEERMEGARNSRHSKMISATGGTVNESWVG